MARHVLACKCGNELAVRTAQAGEHMVCPQCNASIAIPSLRELKSLPLESPKPAKGWSLLPERTLPKSNTIIGIGMVMLIVALCTPALVALGLLEDAFSYAAPADPRRAFFRLDNAALWTGLGVLTLAGIVSLLRGFGYPLGGVSRNSPSD